VHFKCASGSQCQGMWMENGSGGFFSDLVFEGGIYGLWVGNQQFTSRNITISGTSLAAVYMNWNWVFVCFCFCFCFCFCLFLFVCFCLFFWNQKKNITWNKIINFLKVLDLQRPSRLQHSRRNRHRKRREFNCAD
jgi:hypothetical protein